MSPIEHIANYAIGGVLGFLLVIVYLEGNTLELVFLIFITALALLPEQPKEEDFL